MWIMAGSRKARVLPEPVAEMPTISRPSSAMGQPCDWMGVGELKPCGGGGVGGGLVVDVSFRWNDVLGFGIPPGVLFRYVLTCLSTSCSTYSGMDASSNVLTGCVRQVASVSQSIHG